MGGATGTALCTTIMQLTLQHELPYHLQYEAKSTFTKPDLAGLFEADKAMVHRAYDAAMQYVWLAAGVSVLVCLVLCLLIEEIGDGKPSPPSEPAISTDESGIEKTAETPSSQRLLLADDTSQSRNGSLLSGQHTPLSVSNESTSMASPLASGRG